MRKFCFIMTLISLVSCKQSPIEQKGGKGFDEKLQNFILENKKQGVEYFIKENNGDEILVYEITYLGRIINEKKEALEFIYYTVFTGVYEDSKKANSAIVIFNNQERLGHYYVGGGFKKTPVISQNKIIISYDDSSCNQSTLISFNDSIPKQIFIHCKEQNGKMLGDLYTFEKQK